MAIDPLSAGLSAVSLISGKGANDKARKDAKKAQEGSKALEQRAISLWDKLFARAEQSEKDGTFDPEKRIQALEKDTAHYESQDLGNLAGAMTVAGYRPGDSETGTRLDAVKVKYRRFLDNMRDEIRTKSFFEQNAAYQAASPQYLQPGLQGNAQRGAQAQSNIQNPAGFLSNLLPSLQGNGTPSSGANSKPVNWSFLKNFSGFA